MRAVVLALALILVAGPPPATARTADEVAAVRAAVARYADYDVARREGWRPFGGDEPLMGRHYHHPDGPDYVHGDPLNLTRPSNLMYADVGGRKVLTGVAFVVRLGRGEPLPSGFTGRADRWHVHDMERAFAAATETRPLLRGVGEWWMDRNFRDRGDSRGRLAMVHVWTLPNPDGAFALHNRTLPYLRLGLPGETARGASLAAARGVALATPGGCARATEGQFWVAQVPRRSQRRILNACGQAADYVRARMGQGPAALNRAGETAWAAFARHRDGILTPAEKRRIAAMAEHDGMMHDH
ncbi:hypothetical protein DXV76_03830 [Rhodobacteraceae bacterium CCMM004]|nr:hypothetical protein DXV76_03830 [Rhodobacteraceae bacterium CCMM004]